MNGLAIRWLALAGLFVLPALALAQDDDLGVTMTVIESEDAADEAEFVNEIEVPAAAAEQAHENAEGGNENAGQARQQGREFGKERSEEGRNRGPPEDIPGGGPPGGTPGP